MKLELFKNLALLKEYEESIIVMKDLLIIYERIVGINSIQTLDLKLEYVNLLLAMH